MTNYFKIRLANGSLTNGKLATTQRWEFFTKKCEEFHNLEHQLQIDSLHDFLLKCASRISEPTEAIEADPQDNEKAPFHLTNKIKKNTPD